jgi:phosphatidylglycerol:prolipoprotein diacylglycerol transferase
MSTIEELGYSSTLDYYEIVFPKLGIDVHINPTAFTVGGIAIQWYGIIITFGLLLALIFGFRNMRRVGLDPDRAIDGVIGGILGGLVGARIFYVAMRWDQYAGDWKSILNTREGGLAIYGGVIGAFLVGSIVCRIRKVKLLPMFDICGAGFLLGQGIGRWGNFTNQEAFGKNTDSLFCMSGGRIQTWISENYTSTSSLNSDVTLDASYAVHPCFLYESIWCLIGFVLLALTLKKWRKFDGQIFLMYIGWYGLGRAFIESLRTDSLMIGSLRISQCLGILGFVVSAVLLAVMLFKVKRMGRDYVLYCNTEESKRLLAEADEKAEKAAARKQAKKQKKAEKTASEKEAAGDADASGENEEE